MTRDENMENMQARGFEFYKKEESESKKYIMIPKQFYRCVFYKKYLTPTTRELYAWLVDRMSLSEKTTSEGDTRFIDENGYIYLIFSREKIMETLGLSKQPVANAFRTLQKLGLIYEKRLGQGKANRIYIGKVRYLTEIESKKLIKTIEKSGGIKKSKKSTSRKSKSQKSKKSTSGSKLSLHSKVENVSTTNTNNTNTDFINTNISSSNTYTFTEEKLIQYFEESICELRKTTKPKFQQYIFNTKIPNEFIVSVINYCVDLNYKNFAAFKRVIDSYIEKEILSSEEMLEDIKTFRKNKRLQQQKNNVRQQKIDSFNDYEQREYDWPELEKKLLGWKK